MFLVTNLNDECIIHKTNRVADKNKFSVHEQTCTEVAAYTVDEIRNFLTPLLERLKVHDIIGIQTQE